MYKKLKIGLNSIFLLSIIVLYGYFGSVWHLRDYYSEEQRELRSNQRLLRPMYTMIQRELIKSRLELPFALDNLDLILNFSAIQAKIGGGILPDNVKQLLLGVLRAVPGQVTALNLLAIDAYRRDQLVIAVEYWQRILDLVEPDKQNVSHVQILRQKVQETKAKIAQI